MSATARRNRLDQIRFDQLVGQKVQPHAGLWFDKYLAEQKSDTLEPYVEHIRQTGDIKEPPTYIDFFNRWHDALEKAGAVLREAQVIGRLAAGLGDETVIETGLTLHHTYGVPYIPGSSLKGSARAYATANLVGVWAENNSAFRTLFGGQAIPSNKGDSDDDKKQKKARVGIAVFCDALPLPGGTFKIHNEVMTVHHKEYYGDGSQPPADWDSPTPIPFLSVSGRFLIVTYAPSAPEWAESAMDILKLALAESGAGGKTSSGYGRLQLESKAIATTPEEEILTAFLQALANLPNNRVATELNRFVEQWRSADLAEPEKQRMAQAILDKVDAAGRVKQSKEKAWYLELRQSVTGEAT